MHDKTSYVAELTRGLAGKDAIVVLATGAGKSVCFQLPPLIKRQAALIICPTISLMKDQVRPHAQCRVRCTHYHHHCTRCGVASVVLQRRRTLVSPRHHTRAGGGAERARLLRMLPRLCL